MDEAEPPLQFTESNAHLSRLHPHKHTNETGFTNTNLSVNTKLSITQQLAHEPFLSSKDQ